MENLAFSLSKSITEFLEHNERRLVKQNSQQEKHDKLLEDLNNRVEQLETRCQELLTENRTLKGEMEVIKQREDAAARDMITIKSDLEKMHTRVDECQQWVRLMTTLAEKVHALSLASETQETKVKDLLKSQTDLTKQLEKQQKYLNATASAAQAAAAAASVRSSTTTTAPHYSIKTPSRSPSTASFFNGNMNRFQSSTPRSKPAGNHLSSNLNHNNNHHIHDPHQQQFHAQELDYNGSLYANDEMLSEMSDHAESLLNHVHVLSELHQRSFGGGSTCSGE